MAEKSKLWYLENFNLFKDLNEESMMTLNQISSMKEIAKEQPIYFASEPSKSIFFLKTGRVKIVKYSTEGKENILTLINPGEIFGEMAYLEEEQRTDYAFTIEPSLICSINKSDLAGFIEKNPTLNLRLSKIIGLKLRSYSERIEDLIFKDANQRIISFILRLAEKSGKELAGQIFIKPFLKHQDIGEITACSRQTVNYLLTDLRDKNIIDFDRKKLIILKPSELKKLLT